MSARAAGVQADLPRYLIATGRRYKLARSYPVIPADLRDAVAHAAWNAGPVLVALCPASNMFEVGEYRRVKLHWPFGPYERPQGRAVE